MTDSAASSACSRVSATTTATASPPNRILSFVSGQCVGTLMSSVIGQTIGRLEGNASSRSAAVSTAITPGIDAAADVSIRSIRACTYGGRTISIHAIPAIVWLSTKVPWPVSSLASSLRRTDDPT